MQHSIVTHYMTLLICMAACFPPPEWVVVVVGGVICITPTTHSHKLDHILNISCLYQVCIIYLSMYPSPLTWWVNFSPIACCLSDPDDPGESPNRLLLPIRIDWSTAPCQTRSIHHSFSNEACSLAASSFPASLYFHFIIISHSGSMRANRPTVNHTAIRAMPHLLVDSFLSKAASTENKW